MATTFINPTESNSLNFQKFKKKPKNSSTRKSFWAFLLSLLLYVSVFYAFNLSTSNLLCTTKFWFFVSNTLIFIIAADFGAFSSSKEADQFYEEYARYSNAMKANDRVPFPFQPQQPKNVEITLTENDQKEEEDYEKPQEKIINMICSSSSTKNDDPHEPEENKPDIPFFDQETNVITEIVLSENFETKKQERINIPPVKSDAHAVKKRPRATSFRSNSITAVEITSKIDDKLVLKRTLSEGHDEPPRSEENDEYSRMSDEELNRRVEEFIRRFNRQIRLQASKLQ